MSEENKENRTTRPDWEKEPTSAATRQEKRGIAV